MHRWYYFPQITNFTSMLFWKTAKPTGQYSDMSLANRSPPPNQFSTCINHKRLYFIFNYRVIDNNPFLVQMWHSLFHKDLERGFSNLLLPFYQHFLRKIDFLWNCVSTFASVVPKPSTARPFIQSTLNYDVLQDIPKTFLEHTYCSRRISIFLNVMRSPKSSCGS